MTDIQVRPGSESAANYGIIARCLNRVRRRLWLVRVLERLSVALAWGAAVACFFVAARLLTDWTHWISLEVALIPLLGAAWCWRFARSARGVIKTKFFIRLLALLTCIAVAGALVLLSLPSTSHAPAWLYAGSTVALFLLASTLTVRPVDSKAAAIFIDQQVGLKERVATAYEFLNAPPTSEFEAAFRKPVIDSAVNACHQMGNAKIGYARADERLYLTAGALSVAAAAVCFLTPLPAAAHSANKQYVAVIDKGQKLSKILEDLEKKNEDKNDQAQAKLQPLKNTLAELRKGNMSPFEANERLSEERAELQKSKDEQDAAERVEKALDNIKGMEAVSQAADRLKNAAVQNADGQTTSASSKNDAQQGLKDAAGALGSKLNGMSKEDKDKLAKSLDDAAKSAAGSPQLHDSLSKAADAVRKNDGNSLSQNINQAGQTASQSSGQQQLSGQALKDAMDAIDQANGGRGADEERSRQQNNQGEGGSQSASSQGGEQNGGQQGQQGGQQQSGGQQGAQQVGGQQNSGNQSGQQQANSGGSQGGGQQNGGQQGRSGQGSSGQSQSSSGGSTNLHAPSGPGDHNAGKPLGGAETYVRVYDQIKIDSQGPTEKVSGKINPLAPAAGTTHVYGQGEKSDPTIQTYESQLPTARKRAMDDLQTQQIPPQYRDLIRDYYNK